MTSLKPKLGSNRVYSPREIEHLIASGFTVVIYDQTVLKLDQWLKFHPGGDKAVFHMVGRDATDEMNAYHSEDSIKIFKSFKIGIIDYLWENMVPPIQGGKYRKIDSDFFYNKDLVGQVGPEINPKIKQGLVLTKDMKDQYPILDNAIRDPKLVIENYDNILVKHDLYSIPSLDYTTQRELSKKYNELQERIQLAGLYECPYIEYFYQFCINLTLAMFSAIFFKIKHYFLSALLLGIFWQQLVFIAHDAGHISITHNYQIDNIIGIFIADWIGGLSIGWWKRNHNVHHLVTNDPVHDPDIQHLPFFCVSTVLFGNIYSTYYEKFLWFDKFAQFLIPIQHYMYYPILCFGRFNLYRLSWEYLLKGQGPKHGKAAWFRYFELAGLSFFTYWFFYLLVGSLPTKWDKFQYIMVSHVATMIVHVQITLSHFAMSTSDLGTSESFVSRQLRTTMDVDCPEWFDFFHGGLQYQAIHHLFPRLPRHNFRKAQKFIIDFCKNTGLKYSIYGFVDGNGVVLHKLKDIAKQATILGECLSDMSQSKNKYEKKVESALLQ